MHTTPFGGGKPGVETEAKNTLRRSKDVLPLFRLVPTERQPVGPNENRASTPFKVYQVMEVTVAEAPTREQHAALHVEIAAAAENLRALGQVRCAQRP